MKRRNHGNMNTATATIDVPRIGSSTLRVRRYRRRRERVRLVSIEVPEDVIEQAVARGLLSPEQRTEAMPVVQAYFAAQLSDAAIKWLIDGGVIKSEQRTDFAAILHRISYWLERAG